MNRIKHFYSVENLVQKPVGEQYKTHEFSLDPPSNLPRVQKHNLRIFLLGTFVSLH